MSSTLHILFSVLIAIVAAKAIIIGSDFSFSLWFKHGEHYLKWYRNKPKYIPPRNIEPPFNNSGE